MTQRVRRYYQIEYICDGCHQSVAQPAPPDEWTQVTSASGAASHYCAGCSQKLPLPAPPTTEGNTQNEKDVTRVDSPS